MDRLTFISKLVEVLAWPLAVLIAVWTVRKPVGRLLTLITKLKYGELEVDFNREAAAIVSQASRALPPPATTAAPQIEASSKATAVVAPSVAKKAIPDLFITPDRAALAESSPRAAVLEAWKALAFAAVHAAKRAGADFSPDAYVPAEQVHAALRKNGVLDEASTALLKSLSQFATEARNAKTPPGVGAALDFVSTAYRMVETLNNWQPKRG